MEFVIIFLIVVAFAIPHVFKKRLWFITYFSVITILCLSLGYILSLGLVRHYESHAIYVWTFFATVIVSTLLGIISKNLIIKWKKNKQAET